MPILSHYRFLLLHPDLHPVLLLLLLKILFRNVTNAQSRTTVSRAIRPRTKESEGILDNSGIGDVDDSDTIGLIHMTKRHFEG